MSDYVIELCEALERLTGYDFGKIQCALERVTDYDFSTGFPNPLDPVDMNRLFQRLRPWLGTHPVIM